MYAKLLAERFLQNLLFYILAMTVSPFLNIGNVTVYLKAECQ